MFSKLALIAIGATLLLVARTSAFGGKEKSPEEIHAENLKKAAGKYNNGLKHMAKARKQEEKSDSLYAFNYRATQDAKARREYKKAIKDFNKSVEHDPEMFEAFSDRGYCLRKLGQLKLSLASYNMALELQPDYAPALEYRGEAYLALNRPKDAENALAELQMLIAGDSTVNVIYVAYSDTLRLAIEKYKLERFTKAK
ncbi:MAG: tetratricopeptide repeat protein [Candidatus Zixiibacteriota bacterium]